MGFGEHINDEIGRCFCKDHRREVCHQCCLSFDMQNRHIEEAAGLVKPKTPVENAAIEKATAMYALRGMERMVPRPPAAVFEQNREFVRRADAKLQQYNPAEVAAAMKKALETESSNEIEQQALVQAWAKKNPGQRCMEVGGEATQEIYDQVIAKPASKQTRAEAFTCDYCATISTTKLKACAKCKKVSYCGKECQTAAWKAHKKICVPWTGGAEPKTLHLTWEQLERMGSGQPVQGRTLEVRAVLDESITRQVFQCKDRIGVMKRVAAYTNSRKIPGLKQGSLLRWKNPRFHYFMDGSSGARIEEGDVGNVTIS